MKTPAHPPTGPDLSVVVAACDGPVALAEALAALAEQRHVRLEVLVPGRAPDPSAAEVVEKFRQRGLDVVPYAAPTRSGDLGSRLRGMGLASAPWLGFLEAGHSLTGPDAYAEALDAAGGETDILHCLTLSQNSWGIASCMEGLTPFAEKPLEGQQIFTAWLDSDCMAPAVWDKFYSRRLCEAVARAPHGLDIRGSADLYLSAWFFLLAKSYAPAGVPVFTLPAPMADAPETSAARALDCLRMFLELPAVFAARGLPEAQVQRFRHFLRGRVAVNGTALCDYLMGGAESGEPSQERMEQALHFGSEEELFLALAVANGSNANALRDISHILWFSW